MRHYPFVDPSGGSLDHWRTVRAQLDMQFTAFVQALRTGVAPPESYANSLTVGN